MQFTKRGSRYSVVRTTGPSSYLLAFEIGAAGSLSFEAVDRDRGASPSEPEIQRQILLGIADAATELGFQTQIRKVQYSTADVGAATAFRGLAKELLTRIPIVGAFTEIN